MSIRIRTYEFSKQIILEFWITLTQEGEKKMKEAQDEEERKESEQKNTEDEDEDEDDDSESKPVDETSDDVRAHWKFWILIIDSLKLMKY